MAHTDLSGGVENWYNSGGLEKGQGKQEGMQELQGNHSLVCAWESFRPCSTDQSKRPPASTTPKGTKWLYTRQKYILLIASSPFLLSFRLETNTVGLCGSSRIDLKAAGTVCVSKHTDRAALWTLLQLSTGLPQKIVDLMKELYTDIVSAVRIDGHSFYLSGSLLGAVPVKDVPLVVK